MADTATLRAPRSIPRTNEVAESGEGDVVAQCYAEHYRQSLEAPVSDNGRE